MLSAVITTKHSYPAMLLAEQLVHQRFVQVGPLVLDPSPLKFLRPQKIGDQPVSRRFEPSSRDFLIGEQPNPWDLIFTFAHISMGIRLFHHHTSTVASMRLGVSRVIETLKFLSCIAVQTALRSR